MAGTVNGGQAAQIGMSPTDQCFKEQNSPQDQQEQACSCEDGSCCVSESVKQQKPESTQTPNITQALAATPVHTQNIGVALELCWYCLKSLPIEDLNLPQMDGEDLTLSSSGGRVHYQRDPRPHFGVAHSSRSVSFPLWDSDSPREMIRREDEESVSSCPHCHLWLTRDTLHWHEAKCMLYDGQRNSSS